MFHNYQVRVIEPIFAVPTFIAFTIVGYIVIFNIFIKTPIRGFRHLYNLINKNIDVNEKLESKEIVREVGKRIFGYLLFCFAFLVGFIMIIFISTIGIQILTIIMTLIVFVLLLLIYIWIKNQI